MDSNDRGLSLDSGLSLVGGPQSPLDMKPDTATLLVGNFSPAPPPPSSPQGGLSSLSGGGLSNGSKSGANSNSVYPPNHPLSGSKHLCSICGDRASGKHYGVYSCEGCKGFFKRTVRKDLSYACREDMQCLVDKRQRNRCQYCRYQKCLSMGMKREAVQENFRTPPQSRLKHSRVRSGQSVQEERQRTKEKEQGEVESTSSFHTDMPVERILEAERRVEQNIDQSIKYEYCYLFQDSSNDTILQASDKQLVQLVDWAKHIPHFTSLPLDDQVLLLRAGWNELLIAGFSHRSIDTREGLVLAQGVTVYRNTAHQAGIGSIFDRVLSELVAKMRDMSMDKAELGCLRAIILYNPDVRGLKSSQEVELLREKVYASLEDYTRQTRPNEPGRFAKLLLRLPSLRSIGLKCLEHLFFYRIIGDAPIDSFLLQMLESGEISNRL